LPFLFGGKLSHPLWVRELKLLNWKNEKEVMKMSHPLWVRELK